jgi:hypothetical protein
MPQRLKKYETTVLCLCELRPFSHACVPNLRTFLLILSLNKNTQCAASIQIAACNSYENSLIFSLMQYHYEHLYSQFSQ